VKRWPAYIIHLDKEKSCHKFEKIEIYCCKELYVNKNLDNPRGIFRTHVWLEILGLFRNGLKMRILIEISIITWFC
jgi:hypothetical protein